MGIYDWLRKLARTTRQSHERRREPSKFFIEPLEPRLLLNADATVLLQATALSTPVEPTYGVPALVQQLEPNSTSGQVLYLDFNGAVDVAYDGPVHIDNVNVRPFEVPAEVSMERADFIDAVVGSLNQRLAPLGVTFTATLPV